MGFLRGRCPSFHQTMRVKELKGTNH